MFKKILAAALMIGVFLFLPLIISGDWISSADFLSTAEDVNASATAVNGTAFDTKEVNIKYPSYVNPVGAITVTFTTDGSGTSDEIDFEFQVSYDDATTWSTAYYVKISVATNKTADASDVVRVTKAVNFYGISHVRLYRIVNNDSANNLTDCNATISLGGR